MRYLFCKKLAACLCMRKPASSASVEPQLIYRKVWSIGSDDSKKELPGLHCDSLTEPSADEHEETRTLLRRMCHLLEARAHREDEQRYEDEKENEMKDDWMLAAAVVDRICAVIITVVYVVGTVVFFVMFEEHP